MEIIHGFISECRGVELKKYLAMARACMNSIGLDNLEAEGPIDERPL